MKITKLFDKGEFVITGEVGPIKGAVSRDWRVSPTCAQEAWHLQDFVHAVNVTDNQSAVMRLGSLAASVGLKQRGIEPIFQLTCRLLAGYRQRPAAHRRPHPAWRPQVGKAGLRPGLGPVDPHGPGAAGRP